MTETRPMKTEPTPREQARNFVRQFQATLRPDMVPIITDCVELLFEREAAALAKLKTAEDALREIQPWGESQSVKTALWHICEKALAAIRQDVPLRDDAGGSGNKTEPALQAENTPPKTARPVKGPQDFIGGVCIECKARLENHSPVYAERQNGSMVFGCVCPTRSGA